MVKYFRARCVLQVVADCDVAVRCYCEIGCRVIIPNYGVAEKQKTRCLCVTQLAMVLQESKDLSLETVAE